MNRSPCPPPHPKTCVIGIITHPRGWCAHACSQGTFIAPPIDRDVLTRNSFGSRLLRGGESHKKPIFSIVKTRGSFVFFSAWRYILLAPRTYGIWRTADLLRGFTVPRPFTFRPTKTRRSNTLGEKSSGAMLT